MRVVIVAEVFLPKIDGVVIRTMNLIRRLQEAGDEVLVVCPQADGRDDSPVPLLEFKSFRFPAYPEYRIGLPNRKLTQKLREFRPDVIHYINPFAFGFKCYDVLLKAKLDIPCVFSFHTLYGEFVKRYGVLKPLSPVLWWLMREYHNSADRNLTVSTTMQEELVKRKFERVAFWPPAVDSQLFHPDRSSHKMRDQLSQGRPEKPLLLTVSRLAPEKNVEFLARVLPAVPEATLAIVGDGPQRADLEKKFAPFDVNFVGYLEGERLAEAYASCDAFLYASETETMGNVILEAMACGLPVVAPAAGGIPSLVENGQNGFLYQPRDVEASQSIVRCLLDEPVTRQLASDAARVSVAGRSWDDSAGSVRCSYEEVIADHRQPQQSVRRRRRVARAAVTALVLAFRAASMLELSRNAVNIRKPTSATP